MWTPQQMAFLTQSRLGRTVFSCRYPLPAARAGYRQHLSREPYAYATVLWRPSNYPRNFTLRGRLLGPCYPPPQLVVYCTVGLRAPGPCAKWWR